MVLKWNGKWKKIRLTIIEKYYEAKENLCNIVDEKYSRATQRIFKNLIKIMNWLKMNENTYVQRYGKYYEPKKNL